MKDTSALLSCALAIGILSGQAPVKKPGKVEGVVTSSVGGGPVRKATVTLRNINQGYAAISDGAGHFLFDSVEPGSYIALAERSGFMQQPVRLSLVKLITVAEEQQVKDVSVSLVPLGIVSGRVLDKDGDPVNGATVEVLGYFYNQGRKELNTAGSASTNDLGEYQLLNLQPGRYYFQAEAPSRMPNLPGRTRRAQPEEAYPLTYYSGGLDITQATASEIAPGVELNGIDFRLSKARAYHIRGKLADGQDRIVQSVQLVDPRANGTAPPSFSRVLPDGTFDLQGVLSGSYVVMIQQRSQDGKLKFARQAVNVGDSDVVDLVLTLAPGREIPGSMRFDGTPPNNLQNIHVSLRPLERLGTNPFAAVGKDGTFTLRDFVPGTYQIGVGGVVPGDVLGKFPGYYLKSIRLGEQDLPGGLVDLAENAGPLNLVFGSDGGQIEGSVQNQNGQPAAWMMITVVPRDGFEGRQDLFKVGATDQNGSFRFKDVAPGDYKVFAWEAFDPNLVQAAEFRKAFESRAESVSLQPGGHEKIQLKAIPAEEIEAERSKLQ